MRGLKYITIAALIVCGAPALAGEKVHLYTQHVGGVYVQKWDAQHSTRIAPGIHKVRVHGYGKLGDFNGELYLHCSEPIKSKWLSFNEDLFLSPGDVPREAIKKLRSFYC